MELRDCYEPAMERAVKKSLRRLDGHCRHLGKSLTLLLDDR